MADKKISELDAITGAATAADDYFIVVDSSGAATKKISREELNNAIEQDVLSVVDINGGTIDGTTIGGSTAAAGTFTTLSATGNTTLGDAAGDVTQNKGGFAAQGTGLPASGSGVEINFGLVAGEGTVQAFDRSGSAWEQLRLRGNQVAFDISGTEKVRIDSSGNVGLGTSSPSVKLELNNGGAGSLVTFTDGVATNFNFSTSGSVGTFGTDAGSTSLALKTAGSERMRIDSSGRLGLGTSNPQATLNVSGQIRIDSNTTDPDDGAAYLFQQSGVGWNMASNAIAFTTGSSGARAERMRIDSSGRLGVGSSSPDGPIDITDGSTYQTKVSTTGDLVVKATAGGDLLQLVDAGATSETNSNPHMEFLYATSFGGGQTRLGYFGYGSTSNSHMRIVNETSSGYVTFHTANVERMVINNGGDLRVGQATTSTPGFNNTTVGGAWSQNGSSLHLSRNSNPVAWFSRNSTTGAIQSFRYNGSAVGSISVTASATAYNTSSDYRMKENVVAIDGAIDRVKLLRPSRFNFIADPDTTVDGFVAHEVSDIVPEAVHGGKDAVDEDGNPEYQGIDQSKLVPLLTAALQEAVSKIEALEARVAALETA